MDLVTSFLEKNDILSLPKEEQTRASVLAVNTIPWGEARTVEEVLAKNKGTCQGKHLLLQALFDVLQIPYRPVVCTFFWGQQGIHFPANVQTILAEGEWEHGHNFVQIQNPEGLWIDVDVTWNSKLSSVGFRSLPQGWDGSSPFVGLQKIERRWDNIEIHTMKQKLIDDLPPQLQERRKRFLEQFIQWVESINK